MFWLLLKLCRLLVLCGVSRVRRRLVLIVLVSLLGWFLWLMGYRSGLGVGMMIVCGFRRVAMTIIVVWVMVMVRIVVRIMVGSGVGLVMIIGMNGGVVRVGIGL